MEGCGRKFNHPIKHTYQYGDNHLIPAICKKVNSQRKESEYLEILCPKCDVKQKESEVKAE